MKCDTCRMQIHDPDREGDADYCNEGIWEGLGVIDENTYDKMWDDCPVYDPKEVKE